MKSPNAAVMITRPYQALFVVAVAASWLIEVVWLIDRLLSNYTNAGTWTFMITTWVYPVLYFVATISIIATTKTDWLQRAFRAMLLTVIGISIYQAISQVEDTLYAQLYTTKHPLSGSSYWTAFGNDWVYMAVMFVLFVSLLFWLRRKKLV